MADIASLGFAIDSSPVKAATTALDSLTRAAAPAADAVKKLEQSAGVGLKRGLDQVSQSGKQSAEIIALNSNAMKNLGFQLNDAATMLASGSSPFQVMATQSGQVLQVLQGANGGVSGALKQIGGNMLSLLAPTKLLGAGMVAAAVVGIAAWSAWDDKIKSLQQSLNGLGRSTGLTVSSLTAIATQSTKNSPISIAQAMQGASTFAGAGIYGNVIGGLNPLSRKISGAMGERLPDTQAFLASAFSEPAKGLDDLAKKFGPFSVEVDLNVKRLEALGRREEAQIVLLDALKDRFKDTIDTTGYLAKAFEYARGVFSGTMAAIGQIGSGDIEVKKKAVQRQYDLEAKTFNRPEVLDDLFRQYQQLLEKTAQAEKKAEQDRADPLRVRAERIERENKRIEETGQLAGQAITARTAAEKLGIEIERIRRDAIYDTTKAATQAAEAEKARTIAIADATKAMRDYARNAADEAFTGGARTPLDEFRRRTQLERRNLYEQTNVLPPDSEWRSQVKFGNRAENLFNPSANSPFSFPNNVPFSGQFGTPSLGTLSRMFSGVPLLSGDAVARASGLPPQGSGPREITVSRRDPNAPGSVDDDRVAQWLKNRTEQIFFDSEKAIEGNARALKASIDTFGKSTFEVSRANEAVRLENELRRLGIENTGKYAEKIQMLAEMEGKLADARETAARQQQRTIQALDDVRGSFSDSISSPIKALMRGESAAKALRDSATRTLDKLVDRSTGMITEGIFGQSGKPGGGLLGGLLTGFMGGKQNTAMMNVQAGVVNVGGAGSVLPSATGSTGGIGGFFSGLFGGSGIVRGPEGNFFANGGIMTSRGSIPLNRYANGGIANTPQLAMFGEGRGPEAYIPLPDGRTVPVTMNGSVGTGGGQGTTVNVINQSNAKIETRRGRQPNGREMIEFVISEVGSAIAGGRMDGAQSARYGSRPTKVLR